jgi:hypothetical protein
MASASDSFPENGIAAVLLVLPLYAPVTEMVGLIAFTLVVVLGTGDSVAATPPPCPLRPESGSGLKDVLGGGGAPTCANPKSANRSIEAAAPISRTAGTFKPDRFIFVSRVLRIRISISCS